MGESTGVAALENEAIAEARKQLDEEYKEKFRKEVEDFQKTVAVENQKQMEQLIVQYKKELTPPTAEEIQKLLEQEYITFKIQIPGKGRSGGRSFVIRELPQAVEKKFISTVKDKLLNMYTDLEAMKINLAGGDTFKKVLDAINTFEPILDVAAFAVTLSLDPYGDDKDITVEWVQSHLSSTRIVEILSAQMECNRMRDFFSLLSRGFTSRR